MRRIQLNGPIDESMLFGDEMTPESVHEMLYGANDQNVDDVEIILNSYGGGGNAAVQMFDDIRRYPGNVRIQISGTAASAATVLAQAADHLEITPGSLFMIHDPLCITWGNAQDLKKTIDILNTVKDSIIACYKTRTQLDADVIAGMMSKSTWMTAAEALEKGFVDSITGPSDKSGASTDAKTPEPEQTSQQVAEKALNAWLDRKHTAVKADRQPVQEKAMVQSQDVPAGIPDVPEIKGVNVETLRKRLNMLK